MLRRLDVSTIPCFGPGPPVVEPLGGLTLLYGPNGSGKSSIAARIVDEAGPHFRVLRFDQQYIDCLLEDDSVIEGVFTIRDADEGTLRRLKELLGSKKDRGKKSGELPKMRAKIEAKERALEDKRTELSDAETRLANKLWDRRQTVPEELHFAFQGTGGRSKSEFRTRAIQHRAILGGDVKARSEQSLVSDARTLNAPVAESARLLPEVPVVRVLSEKAEVLLREPIAGKEETSFSEFVGKLGNRDWVAAGRESFSRAGGKCPFCQQEAPADLAVLLDSLFDMHYEEQVGEVRALLERENQTLKDFQNLARAVKKVAPKNEDEIIQAIGSLMRGIEAHVSSIRTKLEHPSSQIILESLAADRVRLVALFDSANGDADRTMRLLANRAEELRALKDDIWTYFVADVAANEMSKFDGEVAGPEKAISELKDSLDTLKPNCRELEDEVKSLQERMTSPFPTVEKINKLLQDLGFLSFEIVVGEDDTYRLVRPGGETAQSTLSEGERTLISFLYFYFRALQEADDSASGTKVIVLLDDPVSSLDAESLFVISLLTRRLFHKQIEAHSRLSQVVLMTHNAYFYKEAVYLPHGQKAGDRVYLVLSKGDDGFSHFRQFPSNPIESTYALLWAEVEVASRAPGGIASVTLPNSMRRILENYFGTMGGVRVEELLEKASPDTNWAQWALLSWANDGSHSAPWDVSFAGTQMTNRTLLSAFEGIFHETEHSAHYEMMMRNAGEIAGSILS